MAAAPKKKKKGKGRWELYEVSGGSIKRKNKFCPFTKPLEHSLVVLHAVLER